MLGTVIDNIDKDKREAQSLKVKNTHEKQELVIISLELLPAPEREERTRRIESDFCFRICI